jgi:hypothetical protein
MPAMMPMVVSSDRSRLFDRLCKAANRASCTWLPHPARMDPSRPARPASPRAHHAAERGAASIAGLEPGAPLESASTGRPGRVRMPPQQARAATDTAETSGAPTTNTAAGDSREDFRAHKPGSVRLVAGCVEWASSVLLLDRVPVNWPTGQVIARASYEIAAGWCHLAYVRKRLWVIHRPIVRSNDSWSCQACTSTGMM